LKGRLPSRVAIVTGAATGIGRGIAKALASEGANITVADVNANTGTKTVDEIESLGVQSLFVPVDVRSRTQVEQMVRKTVEKFGTIDILVNNAGVSSIAPILDMTEDDWDFNLDVNAKGTFHCTQAALKEMVRQAKGGRVICISSIAGKFGNKYYSHYSASKWAVIGFVKSVAMEMAKHHITINAVCPGRVSTSMQERETRWEAELLKIPIEELRKTYVDPVPLGRLETPEDVAKVVVFLASDDADYITGDAIEVTGGMYLGS
jgi:acetoin reductase-like protein